MPLNSLVGRLPAGYTFAQYQRLSEKAFGALVLDITWAFEAQPFQKELLGEIAQYKQTHQHRTRKLGLWQER